MKASARVPVLAFAAAFLVSFNVFSNYHDGLLPHVRREDPLTATTASALSILDADASAERAIHDKATAKATAAAFHAHYTAGGTPTRDDHQRELDYTKHRTADRASSSSTSSTTSSSSSSADEREGDSSSTSSSSSTSPSTSSSMDPRAFRPIEHAEYAGDVVKWGSNFLLDSAEACHDACVSHADESPGCNIWVYCPNPSGCGNNQPHRACWLKRQARPDNPIGQTEASNPWTSGALAVPTDTSGEKGAHKRFHVLVTTNAAPYQAWQVRVMYYWYKKMRDAQGPEGQMGGFTRVLHDAPDALMDEIPTCAVDRLENELGFVVLSRPNAFKQFFEKCPEIEEDYVLMAEPDHLFLRPLDNLMSGRSPAAFPFFYIVPKNYPKLIRRFAGEHLTDEDIEQMDPIGSSPVFIHKEDLRKVAPVWSEVTLKIKMDKEADKEWGWVLEMYGYTIASKIVGLRHELRPRLAAQPPWDKEISDFYILHFTYGNDYDENGKFTPGKVGKWHWDKRTWMGVDPPPRRFPAPPKGCDNELVARLVEMVNEAAENLPDWEDPLGTRKRGRGMARRALAGGVRTANETNEDARR